MALLGCLKPQWRGDGICDDENNIASCDYDEGDCCRRDIDKRYCSECKCHEQEIEGGALNLRLG